MDSEFSWGFADQRKAFEERNKKFLERFSHLQFALDSTFLRSFASPDHLATLIIFSLGRLCIEDFFELILLAANGYGYGALKLLRALYEKAVTMAFLSENPDDVEAFFNYHAVAQYKLMQRVKETFAPGTLSAQAIEGTERQYSEVKNDYLFESCSQCHAKRVHHTWHKLDLVSMAKKTIFAPTIVGAYYIPMSHTHSTVQALLSRLEENSDGVMGFNPDLQPKEADTALVMAHNIILGVIEIQKKFFKLDQLEVPLQTCIQDFMEIWKRNPGDAPPSEAESPTPLTSMPSHHKG